MHCLTDWMPHVGTFLSVLRLTVRRHMYKKLHFAHQVGKSDLIYGVGDESIRSIQGP